MLFLYSLAASVCMGLRGENISLYITIVIITALLNVTDNLLNVHDFISHNVAYLYHENYGENKEGEKKILLCLLHFTP